MTMTIEDRNYLFEEKSYLVNVTMNKYRGLLRACRMEDEDVYQELSMCLLSAIGESSLSELTNLNMCLALKLHARLLELKAPNRTVISLDTRKAADYPAPALAWSA